MATAIEDIEREIFQIVNSIRYIQYHNLIKMKGFYGTKFN